MLFIIFIAVVLAGIQFILYYYHAWRQTLFLCPIISMFYMVYIVFQAVRMQALLESSFPLWIRICAHLIPLGLALFFMAGLIVRRYKHLEHKKPLHHLVGKLFLVFLTVVFALVLSTTYLYQEYVIFFPNSSQEDTLYLQGHSQYKQVTIQNHYKGWVKENKNSNHVLVFFGGNAQNSASVFRDFEELGIFAMMEENFISIDYPSYGDSTGNLSQETLFEMADDVIEYVKTTYPDKEIDIVGYSIGTGIASYAASHHTIRKFALISPYNNGNDLFNTYFPIFFGPFKHLIRYPLTSDIYVHDVDVLSFVAYSNQDRIVRSKLSKRLVEAFPNFPMVKTYDTLTHGEMVLSVDVWNDIFTFLYT